MDGISTRLFGDGADLRSIRHYAADARIEGFTVNPSLMRNAGVSHYESFAREVLASVAGKPVSFQVISDDFSEMARQARKLASWQENIYAKIPVTNSKGESSAPVIRELSSEGVKVNVTAILTIAAFEQVLDALDPATPSILSVFAGRVADTGLDPIPLMCEAVRLAPRKPKAEVLWASVREPLNIYQAGACGCQIVTVPYDILARADQYAGMDAAELSLECVRNFAGDAASAGLEL